MLFVVGDDVRGRIERRLRRLFVMIRHVVPVKCALITMRVIRALTHQVAYLQLRSD